MGRLLSLGVRFKSRMISPPQNPQIVGVFWDGSFGQAGCGEMNKKGREAFDEPSAWRKILFLAHPTVRPILEVAAVRQ